MESFAQRRIPVVGIVGGIGSGKSAVANWVAGHSRVLVIDADTLGHEALGAPAVKDALVRRFGQEIVSHEGAIIRSALAKQVFGGNPEQILARGDLERIVHPEIGQRIAESVSHAEAAGFQAVLLDAAVLLEAGWRPLCDLVIFVDTPDATRLARVRENRSWTADELHRRESSQWSLTKKRREADLIVNNDRDLEWAGKQVLESLQQRGWVAMP